MISALAEIRDPIRPPLSVVTNTPRIQGDGFGAWDYSPEMAFLSFSPSRQGRDPRCVKTTAGL
jgi:hypothetical protein